MTVRTAAAVKRRWQAADAPSLPEWALFAILCAVSFLLFSQGFDLPITARHSVSLLDAIAHGQLFRFYSYANDLALAGAYGEKSLVSTASYPLLVYATLAAWNLPLWLFSALSGVAVSPLAYLMWDKVLVVAACLLCARVLQVLGVRLGLSPDASKWAAFAFLTSPMVLFGAVIFAQIDALVVFFMLLGIVMYADRRLYAFCLFVAVAACYKAFPLLIVVPLLALVEKRVLHLAKYTLLACAPFALQKAVSSLDPGYAAAQAAAAGAFDFAGRVFANGVPAAFDTAFFFGLAMIGACVFAFQRRCENEDELNRLAVYLALSVFAFFFAFVRWHPQWLVMLAPLVVLAAFTSANRKLSLLLDGVAGVAYLAISCVFYYHNADQDMVNHALLPAIFGTRYDNSLMFVGLARKAGVPLTVFVTALVGCLLANLVVVFPRPRADAGEAARRPERGVLWARALVILLYVVPALALYFRQWMSVR